jgi:c-di-GMP-related signal transduction protein
LSLNVAPQPIYDNDKKQIVFVIFETVNPHKMPHANRIIVSQEGNASASDDYEFALKWKDLFSYWSIIKLGYSWPYEQHIHSTITLLKAYFYILLQIEKVGTDSQFCRSFQLYFQQRFQHYQPHYLSLGETQVEVVIGVSKC